jgi:sugar porter (SP) family MFS transporter
MPEFSPSAPRPTIDLAYLVFLAATASLGGLLLGFDIAIITGAGPFLIDQFHLTYLSLGWAFSSLLFGCVLGSVAGGRLTDLYGRRAILLVVAALFAITSLATAIAPNLPLFIVARFIGGWAVGGASVVSPMYVAEISPPSLRGRMGALYQMSIVIGILASYAINFALRNAGTANWRWMFVTGVIPAAVLFATLLKVPETPRYLFLAGKKQQTIAILTRIAGADVAQQEAAEITASLSVERKAWRKLSRPGVRRALLVGFCLAILVHVSGINTVIDYAPTILKSAGWKIDAALFSTFIIGITNCLCTFASFFIIDRYGRKPLYIVGSLGMTSALLLLISAAVTGHFQSTGVLIYILIYLAFFASCIGPVFWTLVAEIFPNDVRGTAMTVPVLTQWIANAAVVLFFPLAFNRIGKAPTFIFLAAMSLTQALFTWFFVPETKNRALEQIETYWVRKDERSG